MTAAAPTSAYGWRIGSVRGIPVYLGRSWPVIAIIILVTFGPTVSNAAGESGGVFGFGVAAAYAVLLLLSVLAHEAAHALMATRFGYAVDRIVADLWGGHTVYDSTRSGPGPTAAVAVVGPLANLALAGVGWLLLNLTDGGVVDRLVFAMTLANLFVGLFNLLPGLPLDGGFLVDALVWKATGDRSKGLVAAGWLGRVLTVVVVVYFVGLPLLRGAQPSLFTIAWAGLIGAFLWVGATQAIRSGTSQRLLASVPLAAVLRPAVVVPGQAPLAHVLPVLSSGRSVVVVDPAGRPIGLVDPAVASSVDPAQAATVPVEAVVTRQPAGWVVQVTSGDPARSDVSEVVAAVAASTAPVAGDPHVGGEQRGLLTVLAVSPEGQVLGTVSVADLGAALGGG